MILLADGGSSKVDWRLAENGVQIKQVLTLGANPFQRTKEDISQEIKEKLLPEISEYAISHIFFYGAGCAYIDKIELVRQAISENFPNTAIEVHSDLLAAARGLYNKGKGIACILGTGSNSCFYDGSNIIQNVPSLGFVLGDEGSGAVLGRLFLGACLKNQLTIGLKEKFMEEYNLTIAEILDKVYKQPMPNRYLASFAPFILKNIGDSTIYNLVFNAFKNFFTRNVMQYDYQNNQVQLTGSIVFYFQDIIKDVAKGLDINVGNITASPMMGLIKFHTKQ